MKMPTIVGIFIAGIFIFINRENFMLGWVEHENSQNFGPDYAKGAGWSGIQMFAIR